MGAFLRSLVVLAFGLATGAVTIALQPQWAAEIVRLTRPLLAQLPHPPTPQPRFTYATLVKDQFDGGFNHLLRPVRNVHSADADKDEFFNAVVVTVVVDETGRVVEATPTAGPPRFHAAAVALARQWKFKPFERNGHPVMAKLEGMPVGVHPPEQWQSYRQPFPQVKDWKTVRIGLRRTGCFGTCPSYDVEIAGDGKVTYHGSGFVAVSGEHHATIDQRVVKDLVDEFRRADFFSALNLYRAEITDNPTYELTLSFDGRTKVVTDYVGPIVGMPDAVHDLENSVDIAADTDKWLLGNGETVPSLIAEGWDFKSTGADNLALAPGIAQFGNATALNDLIAAGAPLTASMRIGFLRYPSTALAASANRGQAEMVRALLAPPAKWSKEALGVALLQGTRTGVPEVTAALVEYGADAKFKIDGQTALMAASESGVPDVVAQILYAQSHEVEVTPSSKTDVNERDSDGKTALIYNASAYRPDKNGPPGMDRNKVALLLLQAGARVGDRDNNGNTALIANHSFADVAAALIKAGADVNAQNTAGETALMNCLYPDVAEVLLRAGANPDLRNAKGQTALDVITARNYGDGVAAFLKKWIADHPKTKGGRS